MSDKEYTPYQQKVIKRYYDNQEGMARQRLAELVADLYLATGKKRERLWTDAATAMKKMGVSQGRIDHLIKKNDPVLLAQLVEELEKK